MDQKHILTVATGERSAIGMLKAGWSRQAVARVFGVYHYTAACAEDLTALAALPMDWWTLGIMDRLFTKCAAPEGIWNHLINRSSSFWSCVSLVEKDVMYLGGAVLKWTLSWPPCSVGFAATSTSSSERLSLLHSSSWHTGISSASGLCRGSPTYLFSTVTPTVNTFTAC